MKMSKVTEVIAGALIIAGIVWFVVSCMQVSNQNVQPWNLIELIFGKL